MEFGVWKYMFANPQYRATGQILLRIFPNKPRSSAAVQYNKSSRQFPVYCVSQSHLKTAQQGKDLLREIEVHTIQRHGFSSVVATGRNDYLCAYKKTKPDSLTSQGLPGINTAKVVLSFD